MALQTQFVSSFTTRTQFLFSPSPSPSPSRSPTLTIRSEKPSESSDSAPKTPPGLGFGPSSNPSSSNNKKKPKQQKGQRASSIIRRTPVEKPAFVSEQQQKQPVVEQSKNETAFILAWLGFGAVILVEGIALAASGFLPEEWDKLFVKYLYPSFTPTVFLFVAGAVAFGVFKYKQNENITDQK